MKGLHKFSFYNYFKSVTYAPILRVPVLASVLAAYFVMGTTVFGGITSDNGWAFSLAFICSMVFMAGIIMGNYYNRKPDLVSLMPISPARSIVYRFLSVLVMAVLMIVVMVLVFSCIFLIICMFSLIPGCNEIMEEAPDDVVDAVVSYPVGVYGGIFSFAFFMIMYSGGIIAGLIKRQKLRNIFLLCFCAGILLGEILMSLPFMNNPDYSLYSSFKLVSPFLNICYEAMALPQLCIALCCVVAAAMFGFAVYLGIRENKLKSSY